MAPAQWILVVAGNMTVELPVFIITHIGAATRPKRLGLVNALPLRLTLFLVFTFGGFRLEHPHGYADVI